MPQFHKAVQPGCVRFNSRDAAGNLTQAYAPAIGARHPVEQERLKLRRVAFPQFGKEMPMRDHMLKTALAFALPALFLTACQTDTGTGFASGAAGGAVVGALVGGPVGAAVGGVAGAAVGGALTAEEYTRVRTYLAAERRPSVWVTEQVAVGQSAPLRARLYPVPASVGLRNTYSYTIVNDRTVLVDPRTREIVEVIE